MSDRESDKTGTVRDGGEDYRALFDEIEDGFAVIELIADADGRTIDVLHIDANPAYERHTGIHGIVGKRASDVGLERGPWYDAYTEVARTGTAARIEAHIVAIDRWFSAHVSRIGGDGSRTLAVVFHDITDRRRAEAALRESETRYRLLFEGIDEGFCLCERVPGEPVDYRYLTVNPAFERQSGLRDAVGKTMRELVPMVEESIMERYRQAEESGESARFESHVAQLDRWFEIEVTPGDAPGQIAILFRDITMRQKAAAVLRDSEERQKFLLTLTDTLRPLSDAGEIERQATRLLGEHLQADRCFLSPVYDDGSGMCVREEYLRSGASSVLGDYTFAQFGDFVGPTLHAGHVLAVENVADLTRLSADERASYAATEIAAYLLIPVTREGRLAAFLTINHRAPRAWSDADKAVARQTADRLWTARERTLAETALHESEAERRSLIAEMNEGFCILEVILDEAGNGVDYRFLETNPAFVRQGGFDPAGRLMSEIAPIEPVWPAAYGRVATTGVPERIVDAAAAFGRTYDVYAFRVGDPDDHRIAVFFTDISTRKRAEEALRDSEERQTFLLKLSDALRPIRDATAIQQVAVRLLGEHLGVNRAGYYEVGPDQNTFYLTAGWERGLPPLPDRMLITDFGEEIREGYLAGHTMAASDTEQEAASDDNLTAVRAIAVRAWIGVPLIKDGRWVAAAGVHSAVPRDWTPAEIRLVEDVAERIWAAAERARVEAALRDTQEQQRLMLQLVPALLWSADPAGREITLNERWTNFTGQSDAETQDFGWLDAIHPDDLPATQAAFAHAFATGEPIEREHRVHLAGDGYRWHLVRHVPVRDDRGEIVRWFGAAIDIHDMRLARQALREREEQLALAVDIGAIGHWAYDIATGDFETSAICRRNFGRPEDQPFSYDELVASIHPDDRARQEAAVAAATASRTPIKIEYRLITPDGDIRWIDIAGRFVDGAAPRLIGVSQDITARKLTAIALQESEDRLRVLVAELQHRVRNILTVIRSVFARTTEAGGTPEEISQHFRGRLDSLARTQVVVTQSVTGLVDLENLIRDELLSVGATDGPTLTIAGPDVALPSQAAESMGLAIHELTTNALKYGALKIAGATLDIRWSVNMGYGDERRLDLTWTEQGVPAVPVKPSRYGFGSELIEEALPYRLGAETTLQFRGGGVCCSISLPLPGPGASAAVPLEG